MGKIGTFQPADKYKNYSLPTSKPFASDTFYYKQKEVTLQEQIYKKLKKVSEFLESLYPTLTDDYSRNIKTVIEKNLEKLSEDLDQMKGYLNEDPYTFNTAKLKINQHCITEMKNVCDILQTLRNYEHETKKLGKIKHALTELEHLIQPTNFEKSLERARAKSKPKKAAANKERISAKAQKKSKEKPAVKSEKPTAISKKAKAPAPKLKQSAKKATKSKTKLPAKHKKALAAKPKLKSKSSAKNIKFSL